MRAAPRQPGEEVSLRGLRRQIRTWRRGRADTRLVDALSDAYIAVFATLMLSSMAVSVVVNVRTVATARCTPGACTDARAALPWLFGLTLVSGTLALARLLGPMLVSPAVASWLLPTPVGRAALLRPRLLWTGLVAFVVTGATSAAASTLAGFAVGRVVAYTVGVAAVCLLAVALAVVAQARRGGWVRWTAWLLAVLVWAGLLTLTVDAVPASASTAGSGTAWFVAAAAAVLLAVVAAWRAHADLPRIRRDRLTAGGALVPGMSGALASLDFALVFDLLTARHWRAVGTTRVARGRGDGAGTLVWREVVRLGRTPQLLAVLAAALVVPYLGRTLGLGRTDLLVATTTGFVAGTALFSSLRVLSRSSSLARCLPQSPAAVRSACLSVPALVLLGWAMAATPAFHDAVGAPWADTVLLGCAVGATSVAAGVRWVTGRPPNYQLPLVTSPMGAVPTSLYVSAARGIDALLLGSAPLLLAPTAKGAAVSLALDAVVLAVLVGRR